MAMADADHKSLEYPCQLCMKMPKKQKKNPEPNLNPLQVRKSIYGRYHCRVCGTVAERKLRYKDRHLPAPARIEEGEEGARKRRRRG